ncbi:MAG: hypothetical protein AABY64_06295 [Bdellovibrionota bacterium]
MVPQRRNDSLENWDLFVLRHQNLKNVAVHTVSCAMFWLGPILAVLVHPINWLMFFGSGLVGTAGHYFFKDGTVDAREATSSLQVVVFSTLMTFLFLRGQYQQEILRVQKKWTDYKSGLIPSHADLELFGKLRSEVSS